MAHEGEAALRNSVQGGDCSTACSVGPSAVLAGVRHIQLLRLLEELHHLLLVAALLFSSFLLHRIMRTDCQGMVAAARHLHFGKQTCCCEFADLLATFFPEREAATYNFHVCTLFCKRPTWQLQRHCSVALTAAALKAEVAAKLPQRIMNLTAPRPLAELPHGLRSPLGMICRSWTGQGLKFITTAALYG